VHSYGAATAEAESFAKAEASVPAGRREDMTMRRRQPLVGLMGWALSSTVLGADVEIPHQFEAGTPAVAEEINQNFSALAESIALLSETLNDLESKLENRRRGLSVYVDGVRVGTFLARRGGEAG